MDEAAFILLRGVRKDARIVVDEEAGKVRERTAGFQVVKLEGANDRVRHAGVCAQLVFDRRAMHAQVNPVRQADGGRRQGRRG